MKNATTIRRRSSYSEIDRMGIVYYGIYLSWFEVARVEWLREREMPYKVLEEEGILLPVIEATCKYRSPVTYDQEVEIEVWPHSHNSRGVIFRGVVRVDGKDAVTSEISLICTTQTLKVRRLPRSLLDAILSQD